MVQDADPDEARPEQRADRGTEGAAEQPSEPERQGERHHTPHREELVHDDDVAVGQQVDGVAATMCGGR
jgi:hypothetical protein